LSLKPRGGWPVSSTRAFRSYSLFVFSAARRRRKNKRRSGLPFVYKQATPTGVSEASTLTRERKRSALRRQALRIEIRRFWRIRCLHADFHEVHAPAFQHVGGRRFVACRSLMIKKWSLPSCSSYSHAGASAFGRPPGGLPALADVIRSAGSFRHPICDCANCDVAQRDIGAVHGGCSQGPGDATIRDCLGLCRWGRRRLSRRRLPFASQNEERERAYEQVGDFHECF